MEVWREHHDVVLVGGVEGGLEGVRGGCEWRVCVEGVNGGCEWRVCEESRGGRLGCAIDRYGRSPTCQQRSSGSVRASAE